MEAGYDYTLLAGRRPQKNKTKYVPALIISAVVGALLFSAIAVHGYTSEAKADQAAAAVTSNYSSVNIIGDGDANAGASRFTRAVSRATAEDIARQELYPAGFSDPSFWVNPLAYE